MRSRWLGGHFAWYFDPVQEGLGHSPHRAGERWWFEQSRNANAHRGEHIGDTEVAAGKDRHGQQSY